MGSLVCRVKYMMKNLMYFVISVFLVVKIVTGPPTDWGKVGARFTKAYHGAVAGFGDEPQSVKDEPKETVGPAVKPVAAVEAVKTVEVAVAAEAVQGCTTDCEGKEAEEKPVEPVQERTTTVAAFPTSADGPVPVSQ